MSGRLTRRQSEHPVRDHLRSQNLERIAPGRGVDVFDSSRHLVHGKTIAEVLDPHHSTARRERRLGERVGGGCLPVDVTIIGSVVDDRKWIDSEMAGNLKIGSITPGGAPMDVGDTAEPLNESRHISRDVHLVSVGADNDVVIGRSPPQTLEVVDDSVDVEKNDRASGAVVVKLRC